MRKEQYERAKKHLEAWLDLQGKLIKWVRVL